MEAKALLRVIDLEFFQIGAALKNPAVMLGALKDDPIMRAVQSVRQLTRMGRPVAQQEVKIASAIPDGNDCIRSPRAKRTKESGDKPS